MLIKGELIHHDENFHLQGRGLCFECQKRYKYISAVMLWALKNSYTRRQYLYNLNTFLKNHLTGKQSTMAQVLETFLLDIFITEVHFAMCSESQAENKMQFFSICIKYAYFYFPEGCQRYKTGGMQWSFFLVGGRCSRFYREPPKNCLLAGCHLESVSHYMRHSCHQCQHMFGA